MLLRAAIFGQFPLERNSLVFQLTAKRLASSLIIHEVPEYTSVFRFPLSQFFLVDEIDLGQVYRGLYKILDINLILLQTAIL